METDFNIRSENDDSGDKFVEGYFIKFNEEAKIMEGMYEEVSPGSLDLSLKENDIRCLFNHEHGMVLGRTGNQTTELRVDAKGLYGKIKINRDDKQAMDILARIERGDINSCSFGFNIRKEEIQNRDDGSVKFVLKDIDLREVSIVTFPAYPTTSIQSRTEDLEQHEKRKLEVRKAKLKEMLK